MTYDAYIRWLENMDRINDFSRISKHEAAIFNTLTPSFLDQADRLQQNLIAMQPFIPDFERDVQVAQRMQDTLDRMQPFIPEIERGVQVAHRIQDALDRAQLSIPEIERSLRVAHQIQEAVGLSASLESVLTSVSEAVNRLAVISDRFSEPFQGAATIPFDAEIERALAGIGPILDICADAQGEESPAYSTMTATVRNKEPLSLDVILSLIGILLSILSFLMESAPDRQRQQISEQQDIIIAQNDQLLQLEREKLEQAERNEQTCQALLQAVNTLTEKVDALTEQLETQQASCDVGDDQMVLDSGATPNATVAQD